MNIKLVDSLVTIIDSLSQKERELLQSKINLINQQTKTIAKRERKTFNPPLDEYINITRDERNNQQDELIRSCFGGNFES